MREGHLNWREHRESADRILQALCIEDGMCRMRAWWVYRGVRRFAGYAARPEQNRPVLRAPRMKVSPQCP